jgi:hypothetical protein
MHAYFTSTGDFHLILAVQTERTFLLLELNVVQSFIVVLQFRSQNERQITKLTPSLHRNFTRAAYRPYQHEEGICSILMWRLLVWGLRERAGAAVSRRDERAGVR